MCDWKTLVLVAVLLGGAVLLCIGSAQSQPNEAAVRRLLSDDETTREQAKQELFAARTDLISQLISIVDNEQNQQTRRESVRAAMFILGEMRALEAVDVLVTCVAFPYVLPSGEEPASVRVTIARRTHLLGSGPLDERPAIEALVKIGEPCLKAIIGKLATTYDVREQAACIRVLIELRERDAASAMLGDAIAQETDLKKRERLHNSLDMLLSIGQRQTNVDQS